MSTLKNRRSHRLALQQECDTLTLEAQLLEKEVDENRIALELERSIAFEQKTANATKIEQQRSSLQQTEHAVSFHLSMHG
jgi:hypothetical protein